MTDLNIVALKRKAGCSERCNVLACSGFGKPADLVVSHSGEQRDFDSSQPEWVNGVIDWLRGLKHE